MIRHLVSGSLVTLAIVASAAAFSAWPDWRALPADTAVLSLSFSHGGARDCRPLTEEELAKLPSNMRRREVCDRTRAHVRVALEIDGRTVLSRTIPPGGLAGDGPARIYERFPLVAGAHSIVVRMADTGRDEGFDHEAAREVTLSPAEHLVIDFRPEEGGFVFQ